MSSIAPAGSIFDAVGGSEAFVRIARAFHARALADEVLNHPFSHQREPQHVERLGAYWAEALGGPATYTREMSDQTAMLRIHANNGAGHDFHDRFLGCFMAALDDAGVSGEPALRNALEAYIAWSLGDVLQYAPDDAVVPDALPVPQWSWDGRVT